MRSPYFNEEHQLFRESARDFFDRSCRPHFDQWEKDRRIPREIWREMGQMDYLGLGHDEEDGGLGLDFFYSVVFLEELARAGNGGFASAVSVHVYMATNHLARVGSPALKEKYLRPAIAGEMVAALGISEPAAGSDVSGIRTTARREGDHFIVNGGKNFITNGTYADYIVTAVKTEKGISLLLIEGDSPGVSRTKLDKIGWHSSDTAEIGFSDVKVPVENLVGEEGKGFAYIMDSFQLERLVAGVLALGGMDAVLETTLKYMAEREAFGRPINKYQVLRHRIADLATEIENCRAFVHHTSWLHAQGEYVVKECSMVKLKASELANRVVDECLQMFGGYGYMEEYPIARAWRDSRVGTIAGGTSDIMREIIAKTVIDGVSYQTAYHSDASSMGKSFERPEARQIAMQLPERFRADKAGDYATVVHYDIHGPRGGKFTIVIGGGKCQVSEGWDGEPKCKVTLTDEVYEKLETGQLDPQTALMSGQVEVSDLSEMMQFTRFFKRLQSPAPTQA